MWGMGGRGTRRVMRDEKKREWRMQGWSREVGGGDKRENGINGRRKRGGDESGSGSLKLLEMSAITARGVQ